MIFDFDNTFFVHLVLFAVMMVLFRRLFATPWLELQGKREALTSVRIERAEKLFEAAATLDEKCEHIVSEERSEALEKREKRRYETVMQADQRRLEADKRADRYLAESEREILYRAWMARRGMHDAIEELALSLTRKVIRREPK